MARLISLNIDVTKIDKTRLYKGEKGTYLKLTAKILDEADQYGRDVQVWEEQTEEERKAKQDRNFLGGGKTVWTSSPQEQPKAEAEIDDDLPF